MKSSVHAMPYTPHLAVLEQKELQEEWCKVFGLARTKVLCSMGICKSIFREERQITRTISRAKTCELQTGKEALKDRRSRAQKSVN